MVTFIDTYFLLAKFKHFFFSFVEARVDKIFKACSSFPIVLVRNALDYHCPLYIIFTSTERVTVLSRVSKSKTC